MKHYLSENIELMKDWDYNKNDTLDPSKLSIGSSKKVHWKCSRCGYEWEASIYNRTSNKTHCPKCSNRILVIGKNDLVSKYPDVAKEWNQAKNNNKKPENFRATSHTKVWWKCSKCGYEWEASINNRTNKGSKCPKCTKSSMPLKGISDLATTNPDLVKEWDYELNDNLSPNLLKAGSSKKVWWKCSVCGHIWKASIYSRTRGSGCPFCIHSNQTSYPEQAIFYYVKQIYPDAINRYKAKFLGRMELDIYIPSIKMAIEYDGEHWHPESCIENEKRKYEICKKHSIKLIRIKEKTLSIDNADYYISADFKNEKYNLTSCISKLLKQINCTNEIIYIDLEKDEKKIREMYQGKIKNSLSDLFPDIAKEWHPTKNGKLKPNQFHYGSEYKAWWKCSKCGYEWETDIKHRTREKSTGCPVCSHQKLVVGINDLATTHPKIAKEWHPTKNGNLTPKDVITSFGKKFWWKCSKCGYEWEATINHRKASNSGCPLCANKVVVKGINDLSTLFPELAKEWHPTKNGNLEPDIVNAGSNKKVWWKCHICGKEWEARISSRVRYKSLGCHSCNLSKLRRSKPKNKKQMHFDF